MEFDKTLLDAGAAAGSLRLSPPASKRPRLSENAHGDNDAVPGWEYPAPYEQWLDYSAYENRFRSPTMPASRQDSPKESDGQSVADEDEDDEEEVVEVREIRKPATSIPSYLQPNVDMTTALLSPHPWVNPTKSPALVRYGPYSVPYHKGRTERLDLVPHFYSYAIISALLPIRQVQHQLVINYFQYIHPMFPVVDEFHFTENYRKYRGCEQFMDPEDFMVYQAIVAAGFGHLSESQLQKTPYVSVHEGQKAQFDQVKARYWSEPTSDPVTLTQICLIISLWSPGSAGTQNNSYWLNLAFKHATAGELWKTRPTPDGRQCRCRLLWWCCMVRDRVLALGMRRPYRLHKDPYNEMMISELDFGLEATSPMFTDIRMKRIAIMGFFWLCKLSEIMAAIAVFQRCNRFSRDWATDGVGISPSELEQVSVFDRALREWKDAFEAHAIDLVGHDEKESLIPFIILRVVCNCLLAVLYQPYLHLSWVDHTKFEDIQVDPLQRMKEGAQAVESSVLCLISSKKSDTLPNWLVSWVTLPAAVHYVRQCVKNTSADKVLVPCLNKFMRRTTGAQHMFLILIKATKESLQQYDDHQTRRPPLSDAPVRFGRKLAPATNRFKEVDPIPNMARITEARILASVTKALDHALELNC